MKFYKVFILAFLAVFAFGSANAQINVRIGHPHHPRRVVVVKHHDHRHHRHYHH